MPWGRLDDGLYDHPKLDKLGRQRLAAVGLWALSISWCNRRLTDGFVPCDRIRLLGGTTALADLLVAAEMFEARPDGYLVHDFLDFNDSAVTIQSRRDAAAERQRKKRDGTHLSQSDSQRDAGVTHSVTSAPVTATSQRESLARAQTRDRPRPDPTRPIPDQGLTRSSTGGGARPVGPVDPSDDLGDLPW